MGVIAAILIAGGIVALIVGGFLKFQSGQISKATHLKSGDAPRHGGGETVSVEGAVQCAEPLISPVTGTPCIYYELKVIGSWKSGDSSKSKDYIHDKVAAQFALDDGSGPCPINASEGGARIETKQTFKETKKEGFFADLKGAVGKGEPIMFGNYAFQNPPMSKANSFECIEKVMEHPPGTAFALGKIENGAIKGAGMFGLMLAAKSRDDMLGSSAKNAKLALIGGAAASGVGMLVGVVSTLIG